MASQHRGLQRNPQDEAAYGGIFKGVPPRVIQEAKKALGISVDQELETSEMVDIVKYWNVHGSPKQ